jgi:heterodisulfide reductase subunit A-like polyferredoxin
LITYTILEDLCTGCHRCFRECPQKAVSGEVKAHTIDPAKCIKCGICYDVCKLTRWRGNKDQDICHRGHRELKEE